MKTILLISIAGCLLGVLIGALACAQDAKEAKATTVGNLAPVGATKVFTKYVITVGPHIYTTGDFEVVKNGIQFVTWSSCIHWPNWSQDLPSGGLVWLPSLDGVVIEGFEVTQ